MSLSNFIEINKNEISNFQQNGFRWEKYNRTSVISIPDFKDLIKNKKFYILLVFIMKVIVYKSDYNIIFK